MKKYFILLLLALSAMVWNCSEEKITVDPELGHLEKYDIPLAGEPGSFQALVRHFYDEYGTYVLSDFTPLEMSYIFTSADLVTYTPIEEGFEEYAITMLTYMEETLIGTFGSEFLRSSLPTRIFLTKTLGTSGTETMMPRGNDYILGYIGDNQTTSILSAFTGSLFQSFLTNLYTKSDTQPTTFFSLRAVEPGGRMGAWTDDPLQQFPNDNAAIGDIDYDTYYTYFLHGFINPVFAMPDLLPGWSMGGIPTLAEDFADFVTFLITRPASYIDLVMQRDDLPLLRERVLVMVDYLENVFELDVIAVQNGNQPDDKLPADYFDQFAF